jgi:hypothetical protein
MLLGICSFLAVAALIGVLARNVDGGSPSVGFITIERPCLFRSLKKARCTLKLISRGGLAGQVQLLQTLDKSPIFVLPYTDSANTFLCIYDNDVDVQLLRIDLGNAFRPTDRILRPIVLAATCRVERVAKTDTNVWAAAAKILQRMPANEFRRMSVPCLDLVVFKRYFEQGNLVAALENGGYQGAYDGETTIIKY